MLRRVALVVALGPAATAAASDERFEPAVVFDVGSRFDKSFNESAYRGAEQFRSETGIGYRTFEVNDEAQREQGMRSMARRGASVVAVIGFGSQAALARVAPEFPTTRFCVIDSRVDQPNVRSIAFKAHEGSFLVGMIAALTTRSAKLGFVGGMDIPLIRNFLEGYRQGARYAVPTIEVVSSMVGTSAAAWYDPTRAGELAKAQFDQGIEIVYAAAGASGLGVLQMARDMHRLAIGVDSNQNYLYPGVVLTSMLKRVDVAVHDCFLDVQRGRWTAGPQVLGLREDGVGYAIDGYNRALVSDQVERRVEAAKAQIVAGALIVKPYAP
jgi:basic membrane protein A and related proteins